MERIRHTLETATADILHLIKEGFFPFAMVDEQGNVVLLLVDDRATLLELTRETQRLIDRGWSMEEIYRRTVLEKLWFELDDVLEAEELGRQIVLLVERQAA